jgi:hypothetical protein
MSVETECRDGVSAIQRIHVKKKSECGVKE